MPRIRHKMAKIWINYYNFLKIIEFDLKISAANSGYLFLVVF